MFAVVIVIASLVGNVVVVYIVSTTTHMRNSMNTLIANMAVADLLMTIDIPYVVKWLFVYDTWFGTFAGSALCKFFHSAQSASVACSVFSLVAISFDRAFAILFPMKTIFTRKVVRTCIALTWLGALGFATPIMIATSVVDVGHMSCNEDWLGGGVSRRVYHICLLIFTFIVPLILISLIYLMAGLKLWSRKLPGHRNLLSNAHKKAKATSKRATFMLITVVVVFVLCWLPFQVREMIALFHPNLLQNVSLEMYLLIPFFGYANSAMNPIMYVIFSENYRREFNRVLCRGQSKQDRYRSTVISRSTTRMTRVSNTIPLQNVTETGTLNCQIVEQNGSSLNI